MGNTEQIKKTYDNAWIFHGCVNMKQITTNPEICRPPAKRLNKDDEEGWPRAIVANSIKLIMIDVASSHE